MRPRFASLGNRRVRLVPMLATLAVLVVHGLNSHWVFGHSGGSAPAADASVCPVITAPTVETIPRARLALLREELRRLVWFEKGLLPYEQGTISAAAAWTDEEPGVQASLPAGSDIPGGYELRWWMANGDDVVADALVFSSADEARGFFRQASAVVCRSAATARSAPYPGGGNNLEWTNPDGFVQQDLYLLRGRRVFRIGVVKAGAGARAKAAVRAEAFSLVDALGCGLPGAGCPAPPPASAIPV